MGKLWVLPLFAVLVSGCQSAPTQGYPAALNPLSECRSSPRHLTQAEALSDIKQALHLFRNAYAGGQDLEGKGFNFEAAENRSTAEVKAEGISIPDLAKILERELISNNPVWDRHLAIHWNDGSSGLWLNRGKKPIAVQKIAPWNLSHLKKPSALYSISDNGAYVLLTLNSFYSSDQSKLETMVSDASGIAKERPVLIDLRANGGGSYIWILDILAAWGYRSSIDLFRDNQWYTASAVEGRRNFLYCETIGSDANPKLVRLRNALGVLTDKNWSQSNGRSAFWLEHQETQLLEHARIFFQHEPTAESKQKRTAKTAILVSSRCASSCEAAIVFLKQLPSVRVFGEPTA